MSAYYCINRNNMSKLHLTGNAFSDEYSYISFELRPCQNTSANGNFCQSMENITAMAMNARLQLLYLKQQVNTKAYNSEKGFQTFIAEPIVIDLNPTVE
jgi:hypothetical protein